MPAADTDVVVTNAALQWVPGPPGDAAGWLDALSPGAWFALQVPGNFNAPSHALMRELADRRRGRPSSTASCGATSRWASPRSTSSIMLDAGCAADAWETTYQQVLPGPDPVLEWVRGTALRPVLAALPPEDARVFEAEYAARWPRPTRRAGTAPCFPSAGSSRWPEGRARLRGPCDNIGVMSFPQG